MKKYITLILFFALIVFCPVLNSQCYEVGITDPPIFEVIVLTIEPPVYIPQVIFEFCNEEEEIPNDANGNTTITLCSSDGLIALDPPTPNSGVDIFEWTLDGNCWIGEIPAGSTTPTGCIDYLIYYDVINPELATNCVDFSIQPAGIVSDNACSDPADDQISGCFDPFVELPVELLDFTATKLHHEILLEWSTATEVNNAYFEVERSADGLRFESMDVVKGEGNSISLKEYTYIDSSPLLGKNYYRLKQVDFDGSAEYSEFVAVNNLNRVRLNLYPNPTSKNLNLDIPLENYQWQIISTNGAIMKNGTQELTSLDLSDFAAGIYYFQLGNLGDDAILFTKQFIVTK